MPHSIGENSANGTSLVASSQSKMAKLHMSDASQLKSVGFFCKAGGNNIYLLIHNYYM
jgi:hypothetical protein